MISIMNHHFVIIYPLYLILFSDESLVQMLSNDMFNDMFICVTFSDIIAKQHKISQNMVKKYGHA